MCWASDINSSGRVAGDSKTAGGDAHAVAWSADGGIVEMPSLGRLENVNAASPAGTFTGFTIEKPHASLHAVLWGRRSGPQDVRVSR